MARPPGTLRVGRYFLALSALLAVLYALVFFTGTGRTPKLGIDLKGGVRAIYTALGHTTTTEMDVAADIMRERVNSTGVTGATVQVQGQNQIVILIPDGTGQDVKNLGAAAKLNFRGLVAAPVAITCGAAAQQLTPSASATPTAPSATASGSSSAPKSAAPNSPAPKSGAHSGADATDHQLAAPTGAKGTATPKPTATPTATATGTPSAGGSSTAAAPPVKCQSDPFVALRKSDPVFASKTGTKNTGIPNAPTCPQKGLPSKYTSTCVSYAALTATQQSALTAALSHFDCNAGQAEPDIDSHYYLACDTTKSIVYLLGPVIVAGTQIDDVSAQAPNGTTSNAYTVDLALKSTGNTYWSAYTSANNVGSTTTSPNIYACSASTTPCADFVAFTLNGQVLSSPVNQEAINGGHTEITGNFTAASSEALAKQLQYGSLPLTFRADDVEPVSATLGSSQLRAALLAGGIGLALVIVYSLIYYRGLGLVTIASLLVSAALTYALLVLLGRQIGFTLDLAGVTGFIVALGITADSFVVFFERIKDEVHEGRSMRVAVPRAWVRARRTILSADTVSFLAAAILYFFASADVQGFAFTLGLSTVLDLVVVFLFTHPIVSLLSRSRAFGSARFTGLDSVRSGRAVLPDEPLTRARTARAGATRWSARPAGDEAETAVPAARERTPDVARSSRAPVRGTAAERAAARRARMRQPSDDEDGAS